MLSSFAALKSNAGFLLLNEAFGTAFGEEVKALTCTRLPIGFVSLFLTMEGELVCKELNADIWFVSVKRKRTRKF